MMSIAEHNHWIETTHAPLNGVQLKLTSVFCMELGILQVFQCSRLGSWRVFSALLGLKTCKAAR